VVSLRPSIVLQQLPLVFFLAALLLTPSAQSGVRVPDNPEYSWYAPLAPTSLLTAVDRAGDEVYAVGTYGHILRSSRHELDTWKQSGSPTQILLNAVYMSDEGNGWAVGHDAIILKTANGKQWEKVYEAIDEQRPLLDVWFRDKQHGFAVGAYGYFLSTSDGGMSWQERSINEEHDYHLNAISDNGSGKLYIAAESGHVYQSTDDGQTWQVLNLPYEGSFFDIAAYGNTVITAGLRGHIFVSHDAGDSWHQLQTNIDSALTSITRLESGQFVVTGHAGIVLLLDHQLSRVSTYQLADRSALSDAISLDYELVLAGEHGVSTLDLCRAFHSQLSGDCE
jgi:photosystem II stability/assembly factor-like uncharacterized protein